MDTIDAAKAVELIEEAVKAHGADYVDPDAAANEPCRYAAGGQPSCIVGTAYAVAGAEYWQVLRMENEYAGSIDGAPADVLPIETTSEALDVFRAAQRVQDSGKTWGEALEAARERAAEVAA